MIRLIQTDRELVQAFEVMHELRPALTGPEHLVEQARLIMGEGAQFAVLEHKGEITTVTCFRIRHMLATGRTMYVDDVVTGARFRSQGHGKAMLEWLMDVGRERGCETFSLDSGTFRHDAHAFYFREGLRITSFHFARSL